MRQPVDSGGDDVSLLDYLIVFLKHKKLIIGITLGSALMTAVISFLLPRIYRGETHILPSQQDSSSVAGQFFGQLTALGIPGSAVGMKNVNDLYLGLLKSRPVLDRVVERFELMKIYKKKYREDARRKLTDALVLQNDRKSGIITVSVEDKDPQRAADMANAFVDELKNLTKDLAVTEAAQRRLFFEEQLKTAKEDLIRAEESMRGFQEKTGAIEIKEQAKAIIESVAKLRAGIAAKEVELKVLRTYATPQNPDLQKIEEELRGMKEQLAKLEIKNGDSPDPLMPTGRMPATGTGYVRKLRDLKYYETLFELMAKQYELAKIDESRDASIIQVIDRAGPPEKKSRPKRTLMVIVASMTGLFCAVITAFFMEYRKNLSARPENRDRIERLKEFAAFRSGK